MRLEETYDVYCRLDYLPCTRQYCPNLLNDRKFGTKVQKSIRDLKKESDELINKFENNKENVELLKKLEICEKELIDLYQNVLAFLYEMVCEDDPFGDHSYLLNMINERRGNHINIDDPDNSKYDKTNDKSYYNYC